MTNEPSDQGPHAYWPRRATNPDISEEEERYWRGVYYMALTLRIVGGPQAAIVALRQAIVELTE